MFSNGVASGFTNVLVGDLGTNQSTPQSTLVAGVPISSVIECQSTTRGFVPPNMTAAQMNAIVTPYNGMTVYNTDVNAIFVYTNGAWVQQAAIPAPTSVQFFSTVLTAANINGMFAAPFTILPSPGVGLINVISDLVLELRFGAAFTGGGNIYLQYGNVAATGQTTIDISPAFLTGAAANQFVHSFNSPNDIITNAVGAGATLAISNDTAAFANGAGSSVVVNAWYSTIPV